MGFLVLRVKMMGKRCLLSIRSLGIIGIVITIVYNFLWWLADQLFGDDLIHWLGTKTMWFRDFYPIAVEWFWGNPWFIFFITMALVLVLSYLETKPPKGIKLKKVNNFGIGGHQIGVRFHNDSGTDLVVEYAELQKVNGELYLTSISDHPIALPEPFYNVMRGKEWLQRKDVVVKEGKYCVFIIGEYLDDTPESYYKLQYHANIQDGDIIEIQIGGVERSSGKSFSPILAIVKLALESDTGKASIKKLISGKPLKLYPLSVKSE